METLHHDRSRRFMSSGSLALAGWALVALAMAALPRASGAQPFVGHLFLSGPTHGYIRVPHSAALNPTNHFTFEAWVQLADANGSGCSSIAGKNYQDAWWVGICGTSLKSYLKGSGSARIAGTIPASQHTHIAVTFDGVNRRHYINGEIVGTFPETGPLTSSTSEVRIGSDVEWEHTPTGPSGSAVIDEVRLWNVARSTGQIRAYINLPITTPQTGLIAVWPFDGDLGEVIGGRDGSFQGSGASLTFLPIFPAGCVGTENFLCLYDRFSITMTFRTGPPGSAASNARVVPVFNPGSGLFYFFSVYNWEVLVKAISGCGLNNRWWIFSAATTNVFYRMHVYDTIRGRSKVYFNYPGPPAPAVTDTSAFATCP